MIKTPASRTATLRFPNWTIAEQAERRGAWLSKWLSGANGTPLRVQPVLALPGWYIERTGHHPVRAYSGAELMGLLRKPAAQQLSVQQAVSVAHQIEQRCRTVELLYPKAGWASGSRQKGGPGFTLDDSIDVSLQSLTA